MNTVKSIHFSDHFGVNKAGLKPQSQRLASKMVAEYPALLSSFESYQNHSRTGQDWTKPTFYEWCNTEYKSFKNQSKMVVL